MSGVLSVSELTPEALKDLLESILKSQLGGTRPPSLQVQVVMNVSVVPGRGKPPKQTPEEGKPGPGPL